jgi:hypothetical protein
VGSDNTIILLNELAGSKPIKNNSFNMYYLIMRPAEVLSIISFMIFVIIYNKNDFIFQAIFLTGTVLLHLAVGLLFKDYYCMIVCAVIGCIIGIICIKNRIMRRLFFVIMSGIWLIIGYDSYKIKPSLEGIKDCFFEILKRYNDTGNIYNAFYGDGFFLTERILKEYPIKKGPIFAMTYKVGHETGLLVVVLLLLFIMTMLYVSVSHIRRFVKIEDEHDKKKSLLLMAIVFSVHLCFMTIIGCLYEFFSFSSFEIQPFFGFSSLNMTMYVFEVLCRMFVDIKEKQ